MRGELERFRQKVRGNYRQRRITGPPRNSLVVADLFTEEATHHFGLSKARLSVAGAIIGGTIGFALDVHAAGMTMLLGTVGGTLVGGGIGYFAGDRLTAVDLQFEGANKGVRKWLPARVRLGGVARYADARPRPTSNLPWELIGRAMEFFRWASTWPHGRQDEPLQVGDKAQAKHPWLPENWTAEQRNVATDFIALSFGGSFGQVIVEKMKEFLRLKKRRDPESVERRMREMLAGILKEMTGFRR
jgi:hypothetical protein